MHLEPKEKLCYSFIDQLYFCVFEQAECKHRMASFSSEDIQNMMHNKFVCIIGDSSEYEKKKKKKLLSLIHLLVLTLFYQQFMIGMDN